jgi:hypothetical protein
MWQSCRRHQRDHDDDDIATFTTDGDRAMVIIAWLTRRERCEVLKGGPRGAQAALQADALTDA